jgi:hypothetical protein
MVIKSFITLGPQDLKCLCHPGLAPVGQTPQDWPPYEYHPAENNF